MEKLKLCEVASFVGAVCKTEGEIGKISTDSRVIDGETLFVALKGERFDANDFVEDVLSKGVKAVIASKYDGDDNRVILVEDTGKAFLDLAKGYRKKFSIPFVALTGSVGKTSTKGMIYSVLSEKYNTMRTEGNLNNEIGVPKTLFTLDNTFEAAVVEMGMNHFGEISRLTQTVLPDIGVITNVGTAHIENLGSREGILKAKCEITEGMEKGSPLILNGDNDMLSTVKTEDFEILRFGITGENLYMKGSDIVCDADGSRFKAICENEIADVFVPIAGEHHVYNALCAMTVGKKLGMTLSEAAKGVKNFAPEGLRQKKTVLRGITFIEDCYNANLDSMKASLLMLEKVKTSRSIAVLGDMKELGDFSESAHRKVGEAVGNTKTDILLTFGDDAAFITEEAAANGVTAEHFTEKEKLGNRLKEILISGDTVLLKGSRSMKMEEIFNNIAEEWNV